jgi:hypothetical protein
LTSAIERDRRTERLQCCKPRRRMRCQTLQIKPTAFPLQAALRALAYKMGSYQLRGGPD